MLNVQEALIDGLNGVLRAQDELHRFVYEIDRLNKTQPPEEDLTFDVFVNGSRLDM